MAKSRESLFIAEVFRRHGARPDVLLFRNETAGVWVGKKNGVTSKGEVVLAPGARMIQAGLCEGSADLVGIIRGSGRWVAMEVKVTGTTSKIQRAWLHRMKQMGAIVAVVKNMDDVDAVLGVPPT